MTLLPGGRRGVIRREEPRPWWAQHQLLRAAWHRPTRAVGSCPPASLGQAPIQVLPELLRVGVHLLAQVVQAPVEILDPTVDVVGRLMLSKQR